MGRETDGTKHLIQLYKIRLVMTYVSPHRKARYSDNPSNDPQFIA